MPESVLTIAIPTFDRAPFLRETLLVSPLRGKSAESCASA